MLVEWAHAEIILVAGMVAGQVMHPIQQMQPIIHVVAEVQLTLESAERLL
jgi:hypothetical protein